MFLVLQIISMADTIEMKRRDKAELSAELCATTRIICLLVRTWHDLSNDEYTLLLSALAANDPCDSLVQVCLSVSLYACMSAWLSVCLSVCPSLYLSVSLMPVCLSVSLSVYSMAWHKGVVYVGVRVVN